MSGAGLSYEISDDNMTWNNYPAIYTTLHILLHVLANCTHGSGKPAKYVKAMGETYGLCRDKYLPLRTLTTVEREYYGL